MKKAIIIGSGFGGLALAIRLQAKGFQVTLFEKNEKLGGHAYSLEKKGYKFDMGPSLITATEIIQKIFNTADKNMNDYIELMLLNPFYRIYFHDKTYIDYSGDSESMKSQMAKFNADDAAKYDDFIENSRVIYDEIITKGLGAVPFNKISTFLKFVPRALKIKALHTSFGLASKYFKDFRHRFIFSFHPLFIGGNPFRVPAIYLMISYLEKHGGVWFAKGGMYTLVEAFRKVLLELGTEIRTSEPVEEILIEHGKAVGIRTAQGVYNADLVISNADVNHTYSKLIPQGVLKKWNSNKLSKAKYSMGTIVIYLGVKKQYPELLHHTLILSKRYKSLIDDIFDRNILPDDFSMYLHIPTRTDPDMAPPGCESMYVLIPVTNLSSEIDWKLKARPFVNSVINFLEAEFDLRDLRSNIEVEEFITPLDFQTMRNSYQGTPWGMEPILLQSAYFRPHNRNEDIPNLYLVGAGTHPGGGLPGVMLSAEATETLIIEDFGNL